MIRDLVTVVCFVCLLAGLGLADRFYTKWKTYVACSEVNLLVAEGQLEKTRDYIRSKGSVLHAGTIDEAVDLCRARDF